MNWYIEVLKKYTVFTGRATRTEYWMFFLVNIVVSLGLMLLNLDFLGTLYALAVLLPAIAVGVRRLHDTNRSGWWMFISLIPFFGGIVLIVFFAQDSKPGTNQYGPNSKEVNPQSPVSDLDLKSESVVEQTTMPETKVSDEVVINDSHTENKTIVESHEALEEKN